MYGFAWMVSFALSEPTEVGRCVGQESSELEAGL